MKMMGVENPPSRVINEKNNSLYILSQELFTRD